MTLRLDCYVPQTQTGSSIHRYPLLPMTRRTLSDTTFSFGAVGARSAGRKLLTITIDLKSRLSNIWNPSDIWGEPLPRVPYVLYAFSSVSIQSVKQVFPSTTKNDRIKFQCSLGYRITEPFNRVSSTQNTEVSPTDTRFYGIKDTWIRFENSELFTKSDNSKRFYKNFKATL